MNMRIGRKKYNNDHLKEDIMLKISANRPIKNASNTPCPNSLILEIIQNFSYKILEAKLGFSIQTLV